MLRIVKRLTLWSRSGLARTTAVSRWRESSLRRVGWLVVLTSFVVTLLGSVFADWRVHALERYKGIATSNLEVSRLRRNTADRIHEHAELGLQILTFVNEAERMHWLLERRVNVLFLLVDAAGRPPNVLHPLGIAPDVANDTDLLYDGLRRVLRQGGNNYKRLRNQLLDECNYFAVKMMSVGEKNEESAAFVAYLRAAVLLLGGLLQLIGATFLSWAPPAQRPGRGVTNRRHVVRSGSLLESSQQCPRLETRVRARWL